MLIIVGGLAHTSCHGLNYPTFRNNLRKVAETCKSTSEKLRRAQWFCRSGQIWLEMILFMMNVLFVVFFVHHDESVAPPLPLPSWLVKLKQTKWSCLICTAYILPVGRCLIYFWGTLFPFSVPFSLRRWFLIACFVLSLDAHQSRLIVSGRVMLLTVRSILAVQLGLIGRTQRPYLLWLQIPVVIQHLPPPPLFCWPACCTSSRRIGVLTVAIWPAADPDVLTNTWHSCDKGFTRHPPHQGSFM